MDIEDTIAKYERIKTQTSNKLRAVRKERTELLIRLEQLDDDIIRWTDLFNIDMRNLLNALQLRDTLM